MDQVYIPIKNRDIPAIAMLVYQGLMGPFLKCEPPEVSKIVRRCRKLGPSQLQAQKKHIPLDLWSFCDVFYGFDPMGFITMKKRRLGK